MTFKEELKVYTILNEWIRKGLIDARFAVAIVRRQVTADEIEEELDRNVGLIRYGIK